MKILNVIFSMDSVSGGGGVERTFQMSRFLAQAGNECHILTTDVGLTDERVNSLKGVSVFAIRCVNKRFYLSKFPYSKIMEMVSEADVIHLMSHWTFQNVFIYFFAKRLLKPYVICAAGTLPVYGSSKLLKSIYNILIGRKIVRDAAFCIAITPDEVEQYKSYGISEGKIIIIPNGVTSDGLTMKNDALFRKKFNIGDNRIILFAGRLTRIKGPDLLLRSFCNLKDALRDYQLIFMGPDDDMLQELKEIADSNGVKDRVSFLGYLGGEDKSFAYNAAELFVIPSRHEAMSIVVLEAGVAGKPVLLTDQCGFNVVADINGGKVVPASVEGLQQGLTDLLDTPCDLNAMGDNLRKFVNTSFLWDSIIKEYTKLYKRMLQK